VCSSHQLIAEPNLSAFSHASKLAGDVVYSRSPGHLRAAAAQKPTDQGTEHQTSLGGEGNLGGHADDDAEGQPDYRTDSDCGSDRQATHVIHQLLPQA
jgi:hypothetical protein